jgi:hypothetical protein
LAKIAFWKIQVQSVLKQVQPFLQCSPFWKIQVQPVLKQVQPVFALFTFLENTGSAGHSTGFVWWKQVQPVFALFTFFCQSAMSAFLKNRFSRFWDRFNRFLGRKVKNV